LNQLTDNLKEYNKARTTEQKEKAQKETKQVVKEINTNRLNEKLESLDKKVSAVDKDIVTSKLNINIDIGGINEFLEIICHSQNDILQTIHRSVHPE
jgi:hypothetical protein